MSVAIAFEKFLFLIPSPASSYDLHVLNIWTSKKIRKKSFSKIKKDFLCNRDFALPSIRKIWFQYDEVSSHVSEETSQLFKYPSSRQMMGG